MRLSFSIKIFESASMKEKYILFQVHRPAVHTSTVSNCAFLPTVLGRPADHCGVA
jgi:hypothetical protein